MKREHSRGGLAFHLNWCLSFAITSNVIADISRAFQWNFFQVRYLTDMINLRPYLGAIRLYDEKINCILQCVPGFQLIRKLKTKDYTKSNIIILVMLFNWLLFAKIFVENNSKQIKSCFRFKIFSKKTGKALKSLVFYIMFIN